LKSYKDPSYLLNLILIFDNFASGGLKYLVLSKFDNDLSIISGTLDTGANLALTVDGICDITGELNVTGVVDLDGNMTLSGDILGSIHSTLGRVPAGRLHGTAITHDTIFDALKASIPATDNEIIVNGSYYISATGELAIFSYAKRLDATRICIYYVNTAGGLSYVTVTDGSATEVIISIAW